MTDGRVLDRAIERVRLSFYISEHTADTPTDQVTVHTGSIPVSSREATVVDLLREPRASGGINNIATILAEIGELDGSALATLAAATGAPSHAAPAGWLTTTASAPTSGHFGSPQGWRWESQRSSAPLGRGEDEPTRRGVSA